MSDETTRGLIAARAAGVVGSRFVVVGTYGADRIPGVHQTVRRAAERHGMHVKSSSSGLCCLPCNGSGHVDDATAIGCVRSSMRCPTCLGRGDFHVAAPKLARPDGWPLCPECGEDELACLTTPGPPEYEWTLARYLEHDLFCYRCGRVTRQGRPTPAPEPQP
jgi:hypothetical protein